MALEASSVENDVETEEGCDWWVDESVAGYDKVLCRIHFPHKQNVIIFKGLVFKVFFFPVFSGSCSWDRVLSPTCENTRVHLTVHKTHDKPLRTARPLLPA